MKTTSLRKNMALALIGAGLAYGGYWLGSQTGKEQALPTVAASGDKIDPKTGRKVLYWHDPMVPAQHFDKPGKSPFMDMALVPVYADEGASASGIRIDPALRQNLGIRLATVRREETRASFEMVGTTQFDESIAEVVQSRVAGYVERLYARSPMQHVKRGEPIASLFVPDWIAPQEEYLALKRSGNNELAAAARQRMRAMSIPDALIAKAEQTGQAQQRFTLSAPVSGVLTELPVRDGAMVSPGMTVAKVAGLDKLWLVAEIPEALLGAVRPGMTVEAVSSGGPERKFSGKVREILPGVNPTTRTAQARLELANRDGSLTPGMLMRVRLGADKPVSRLLASSEAVITTGKRSIVLVAGENDRIQPVVVTTGRDMGDDVEILSGLDEGQRVVASGQFLIDSEASLKAILPKFANDAAGQVPSPATDKGVAPLHRGIGKVEKVSRESITFSHQPIPELGWGAMTMEFSKPRPDAYPGIAAGQEAEFTFRESKDGYVLESVTPAGGRK